MRKFFVVTALFLLSGCASLSALSTGKIDPNSELGKAQAEKEAYFRDPKQDVLIVIEALSYTGELRPWVDYVQVDLSISTWHNSRTRKVMTPIVMRMPLTELAATMPVNYDSLSPSEKMQFDLKAATECALSIMAQSNSEAYGLEGKIYFAGQEQVSDSNSSSFGAVLLSYTLPIAELTRK